MKMLKISVATVNFSSNFHILDCLANNKNERSISMQISKVYISFIENKRGAWRGEETNKRREKRAKETQ